MWTVTTIARDDDKFQVAAAEVVSSDHYLVEAN